MVYVNCTDHRVDIYDLSGLRLIKTIEPSGSEARVIFDYHKISQNGDISLLSIISKSVYNLPKPEKGVTYIVSRIVRESLPGRKDLASPGDPIVKRNKKIGCKGLVINV